MKHLKVENLNFKYGDRYILNDISFSITANSFIGIAGKNGSGKSTLGKLLAGLTSPESGTIYIENEVLNESSIHSLRKVISMVFQNPNNQIIGTKVIDDLAFGLENLGVPRAKMNKKIYEISRKLNIEHLLNKDPNELSGGQKQIVAIAGILVFDPKIIILDEITSMLDLHSKKKVFEIVKILKESHTILMITHDSFELAEVDEIILLDSGKFIEKLSPKELFSNRDLVDKYRLEIPYRFELQNLFGEDISKLGDIYAD